MTNPELAAKLNSLADTAETPEVAADYRAAAVRVLALDTVTETPATNKELSVRLTHALNDARKNADGQRIDGKIVLDLDVYNLLYFTALNARNALNP